MNRAARRAGSFTSANKTSVARRSAASSARHAEIDANNEPPEQEVLVDRPEIDGKITRISGPFCFESTIPAPMDLESDVQTQSEENTASFTDRMIEILRKSPVLRLAGNQTITLEEHPAAREVAFTLG